MEQSTRNLETATLAAVPQSSGQGSALYVINLYASMTPIAHEKPVPGFETYRVYQVSRKEDGRIRYRLRLGFFADQAEAETALALIREHYPTAFAGSLCDEDQRHTRGYGNSDPTPRPVAAVSAPIVNPKVPASQSSAAAPNVGSSPVIQPAAAVRKAAPPTSTPTATLREAASASDTQRVPALKMDLHKQRPPSPDASVAPTKPAATAPQPAPSKPAAQTAKPSEPKVELTLAPEPTSTPPSAPTKTAGTEPFHVGKGVNIPASALSLSLESASTPPVQAQQPAAAATKAAPTPVTATKAAPTRAAAPKTVDPKPAPSVLAANKLPAAKSATAKPVVPATPKRTAVLDLDAPLPDLDSTQTIRALTPAELDDESQPKWFAVQLAVSEQAINLETMPQLDIFAAYCLYSIATAGNGKILHHMRIGFFKEEVSAEAVCGYIKTFFASPTVLRVSVAEYTRFSEGPKRVALVEPKAKVIDISAARDRSPPKEIPVVTQEVVNPAITGRFPKPNIDSTGTHKRPAAAATQPAEKPAVAAKTAAKTKNSTSSSGKHRSLNEALLAEAREVELSESAIRRLPKNNSLFSKLFGKK